MKIEIDYNGSLAVCKVDGKPFNECDVKEQVFAMNAFKTIIKHWNRERDDTRRKKRPTAEKLDDVEEKKNEIKRLEKQLAELKRSI